MKRLAIFVEGYTEQVFILKLLAKLAQQRIVAFEIKSQKFGILTTIRRSPLTNPDWYILIVNCNTDNQVKTKIIESYSSLCLLGYDCIIGIRDIFPKQHKDIERLEKNLMSGLPSGNIPILIHLAILEIESWFIEEISHFQRVDARLTHQVIAANGFDYERVNAADIPYPAETLDRIYQLVGKTYGKTKADIHRTIEALDFDAMTNAVRKKASSLHQVLNSIENTLDLTA